MKRKFMILLLLSCFMALSVSAQTVKGAEALFNEGRYDEAFDVYEQLMKKDSRDKMLRYKAGRALLKAGRNDEAIRYLRFAAERNVVKANYYLYEACFATYRFEQAANSMEVYLQLMDGKIDDTSRYDEAVRRARQAADMMQRMDEVTIVDSVKTDKKSFLAAYRLSSELGELSPLYDSVRDSGGQEYFCYYTGRRDKRIFADRTDDGVTNLMVSYRLIDGWSEAVDLSENINSDSCENYPFELPDGVTLYFASTGHGSLGGYDIFMCHYNSVSNEYTVPVNIGMPFNSPANDYMMVVDEMAHIGWFATDRFQHPDTVVVYEFIPTQEKRLLRTDDSEYRRLAAQLKVYKKAEYGENIETDTDNLPNKERTEINFLVNDGLVYTSLSDFRSDDAKALYLKSVETDKRLKTLLILLEGKRREFLFSSSEDDKRSLRIEILSLEADVVRYSDLVDEYILQTRRAEQNMQ